RAVDRLWQARSDWEIYGSIAENASELAKTHFPGVYEELVTSPLAHDSAQEISQLMGEAREWIKGEREAIHGKTMPSLHVVERDYTQIHDEYVSLGPNMENGKVGAHGVNFSVKEEYDMLRSINGAYFDETIKKDLPKIHTAKQAAE